MGNAFAKRLLRWSSAGLPGTDPTHLIEDGGRRNRAPLPRIARISTELCVVCVRSRFAPAVVVTTSADPVATTSVS